MTAGMSRLLVGSNRRSNCSTQGSADNRAIAPANLIANSRAGCTTDATTNCRIQRGVVRVRVNKHQ